MSWGGIAVSLEGLGEQKIITGMVHLLALPGSPEFGGSFLVVRDKALRDARALAAGGVDAVLVQNRGDRTFPLDRAYPETIAAMTLIVDEVVHAVRDAGVAVGVQLLRYDVPASLAVARICGADFIRAGALVGSTYSAQGVMHARPAEWWHYRQRIGAEDITTIAEIASMHFSSIVDIPLGTLAADAVYHGRADAVGIADPDVDKMLRWTKEIKAVSPGTPVILGGYTNQANVARLLTVADGAIVGSAFEHGGRGGEINVEAVKAYMAIVRTMDTDH